MESEIAALRTEIRVLFPKQEIKQVGCNDGYRPSFASLWKSFSRRATTLTFGSENMKTDEKDARKFAKLNIADLSFRQVKALADELDSSNIDPLALTFAPQMAGIVVTYAKNFVSATGFGLITDDFPEFGHFDDDDHAKTHERLMEARHKIYAHRDKRAAADFEYDDGVSAEAYQVRIKVYDDSSGFTALPNIPDLNPSLLPYVTSLAAHQSVKAGKLIGEMIAKITKGKRYKPGGVYTVGVDFP